MPPKGVTVAGNPSPIRVSQALSQSVIDSPELRYDFVGEGVGMFAAHNALAQGATRSMIRQDGPLARAEYIYKSKDITDVVEIDFNQSQRNWWEAPVYAPLTQSQRLTIIGALRQIDEYAGEQGRTPTQIAAEVARLAALLGALGAAFNEIILCGTSYLALLPVVTFTRSVSLDFGTPFLIEDIGKVFSTTAMNANVPLNPQFVVTEIISTIGVSAGHTLGWLKHGRYGISSDGSAQYIQQYVFDAYPTARYSFIL